MSSSAFYVIMVTVFALYTLVEVQSNSEFCGNTAPRWRNNNETCPNRAVCADVFEQTRDWYNGTKCNERRTLHNCMCPGSDGVNTVCPHTNDAHMLHFSNRHKAYFCKPVCRQPFCNNLSTQPRNTKGRAAVANEVQSREFGGSPGRSFWRLLCRCVRHHTPGTGRGTVRSQVYSNWGRDQVFRNDRVLYTCKDYRSLKNTADWCPGNSALGNNNG